MMNYKTYFTIAKKNIDRDKKRFIIKVVISFICYSLIFFAFSLLLSKDYYRKSIEEIIGLKISQIGYIEISNFVSYKDVSADYENIIMTLDKDEEIQRYFGVEGYLCIEYKELAAIYWKYHRAEDTDDINCYKSWNMSKSLIEMQKVELYKGSFDDNYGEKEIPIYLGYDYRDIPLGRRCDIYKDGELECTYVVAGIIKKNTNMLLFDSSEPEFDLKGYTLLDSEIISLEEEPYGRLYFVLDKKADYSSVRRKLISEFKGILKTPNIENFGDEIVQAEKIRSKYTQGVVGFFWVVLITSVCSLICRGYIDNHNKKKRYGIYIVNGLSVKDIVFIELLYELIVWAVSIILCNAFCYFCIYIFYRNFGMSGDVPIALSLATKYVLWKCLICEILSLIFIEIFSMACIKKDNVSNMIKVINYD